MKRHDLSVGQRLAAGSALIAILIVALAAVVLSSTDRVVALRREKMEVIAPRAKAAEDLRIAVYAQAIAFRNYAISTAPADLAAFLRAQQTVKRRVDAVAAMPKTDAGRALFARVGPAVAEHHASFEKYLSLQRSGASRDELRAQEAEMSARRNRVLEALDAFVLLQQQLSAQADGRIAVAVDAVRRTVVGVGVLTLLASILTALVVTQSVRKPAVALGRAAAAMQSGTYDDALALQEPEAKRVFRDELRQTANVFGRMAAALKDREERLSALASELQEKNNAIQAQNEELQAQSEELQAQAEELQAQAEELQAQTEELQTQAGELRQQQGVLEKTNAALVAAEAQKNRFLAVLGHELRNPLAAITTAVSLLGDGDGDEMTHVTDIMRRQTRHLARLLDDLLDVGRITSGKIVLNRHRIDLGSIVERCVQSMISNGGQAAAIKTDVERDVWIDADETRIEQIISNLVHNATKYTPADGEITVRVARDGSSAALSVSDTGAGIDRDLLPRVFDLFTQGEARPGHPNGRGLGVGLALVKSLVELHGGTVAAASDGEGRGTTVTVQLPLASAPAADQDAKPPRLRVGRSIVLVEDNEDVRRMMQLLLERAGHTVAEAADGPSGFALVAARKPQVAIVDLDLPGFDGCEVARRVRREPDLGHVRMIALSGFGRPEDRQRALAAGFDEHLVKPVSLDRLESVLAIDERASVAT